jgi:hypothetical protein
MVFFSSRRPNEESFRNMPPDSSTARYFKNKTKTKTEKRRYLASFSCTLRDWRGSLQHTTALWYIKMGYLCIIRYACVQEEECVLLHAFYACVQEEEARRSKAEEEAKKKAEEEAAVAMQRADQEAAEKAGGCGEERGSYVSFSF